MRRAFPCLLLLAVLTRLPVLHRAVLDWDESLYFLMASAWRHGALPYTSIWDNKPVGIYLIFAAFQTLTPGVEAMRLASMACVGLLGCTVFAIAETLAGSAAGWVAGLLLVLASLSNDGLSANTELFMACLTALGVLAALRGGPPWVSGLALGSAFMVKYVAAPEILVVLALLWQRSGWRAALQATLAAALPLAATILLYAGHLRLWWACSIASNFRRAGVRFSWTVFCYEMQVQAARWGGLYAAGLAALLAVRRHWFVPVWLLAALAGAASAKSFYDHYFLQALPPLCVCAGMLFARLPRASPARAWPARLALLLALAALPARAGWVALAGATGPDPVAEAAARLRAAGAQSLYVFDSQPILYALTNLAPPTRFVLPSELTGRTLPAVAGVAPVPEVTRILGSAPQFIALSNPPRSPAETNPAVYALMATALHAHYRLWAQTPGIDLYRRTP